MHLKPLAIHQSPSLLPFSIPKSLTMNTSVIVFFLALCFAAVMAGVTRYGFSNAGFQPGGGIASSGHGYGRGYNTFGTNVYYGGGVGGAYASPSHYGR
ncbi:hypothetical protein GHT06_012347 [Daphnia sinensis]|uniref:Uncharacterized protein n=1 Tax=Daphnia sinensis TaxID=1820382 RepID=A0AAD5PZQ9_9CRUS|nr:hypothetical protein GHT06_012347 [Daphnia sinensis]